MVLAHISTEVAQRFVPVSQQQMVQCTTGMHLLSATKYYQCDWLLSIIEAN